MRRLRWRWRSDNHSVAQRMSPIFPPLVEHLPGLFVSRGETAYLVGGVVRDALAGRDTSDVDVAVAGDTVAIGDEVVAALGGTAVLMATHSLEAAERADTIVRLRDGRIAEIGQS